MRTKNSAYDSHPELSRYVATDRYEHPKDDFKTIANHLGQLLRANRVLEVADVGCGNGELLYYLRKQFPKWRLFGFDSTKEFIATARAFHGLKDVRFDQQDLFAIEGTFDVVLATCFLSLFREVHPPLEKMLELCRDGGYLLATGLFNPFDIEVRLEFCDNTRPETKGKWRTDFNRHSQQAIRGRFGDHVQSIEFVECAYEVKIDPDPKSPIRVWSFKDESGKTILINGAQQLANQTLLIIHK